MCTFAQIDSFYAETCGIPNLDPSIGSVYAFGSFAAVGLDSNTEGDVSVYGLSQPGQWATEFPYGTVYGMANCNNSTVSDPNSEDFSVLIGTPTLANSGSNCWCQVTGFTAYGNSYTSGPQCTVTSSPVWMWFNDYDNGYQSDPSAGCAENCAGLCAMFLGMEDDESSEGVVAELRSGLFGAAGSTGGNTSYTVSFLAGSAGGTTPSGSVAPLTDKNSGDTITLPSNGFTVPSGYTFNGWSCNQGIGNKAAGSTFTMPAGNVTCTAQWDAINYTVSFSAGSAGGTTPSGSTSSLTGKHIGDTITLPSSGFTAPSGFTFNGWSCNQGIGNKAVGETFTMPASNVTCTAQWFGYVFSVTTTSMAKNGTFNFKLAVKGNIYVKCGTNGTLTKVTSDSSATISGNNSSGYTIASTSVNQIEYKCTYSSTGTKTIQFGSSNVTEYDATVLVTGGSGTLVPAIAIASGSSTASISGSLSALFPQLGANASQLPNFYGSFVSTKITSIPATLFSGYTTGRNGMFVMTFSGLTSSQLTTVPEGLFSFGGNNVSGQPFMFFMTFFMSPYLTSIPANLFSHVTSGATGMFSDTFTLCSGLTSIPEGLFNFGNNNVSGQYGMFDSTFSGCSGLKPTTSNPNPIPANLFSRVTSSAELMFADTFKNCTNITSIPTTLFSHYTTAAQNMFKETFKGCTGLDGYIPSTLFSGLATQSTPPDATDFMTNIFDGCTNLDETCPSGMMEYTPYNTYWTPKVSCVTAPTVDLTFDGGSAMTCTIGGTFLPPTPAARVGYIFKGWKTCASKINGLGAVASGYIRAYTRLNGSAGQYESSYGLTVGSGGWAVEADFGAVWGMANCNGTNGGSNGSVVSITPGSSGKYCWCQATGFSPSGSNYTSGPQCTITGAPSWVFGRDYDDASDCANSCAYYCTSGVNDIAFCEILFGAAGH